MFVAVRVGTQIEDAAAPRDFCPRLANLSTGLDEKSDPIGGRN